MDEKFDLMNFDAQEKIQSVSKKSEANDDISLVCEAIQLVRLVKSVMTTRREIIDTIKIDGSKMTYERAMRVAKLKAEKIGNCMVIEKMERVAYIY